MRFYNIIVTRPGKTVVSPGTGYTFLASGVTPGNDTTTEPDKIIRQWSSYPNSVFDAGALRVDLDMVVQDLTVPISQAMVAIFGVSLADIGQASDLNNCLIEIYGGMGSGLPLSNPVQSGLLMRGQIIRAYGNWIGTEQSLNLMLAPSAALAAKPGNGLIVSWVKKTPLLNALKTTIESAYPGIAIDFTQFDKSRGVVYDDSGAYPNLTTFAQQLRQSNAYHDIKMNADGNTIFISSGITTSDILEIQPTDLIGQPTWIAPQVIQVVVVMRADIKIGLVMKLPQTMYQSTPSPVPSPSNSGSMGSFQGLFDVIGIRHVGSSRSDDAASWVTIIDAAFKPPLITDIRVVK